MKQAYNPEITRRLRAFLRYIEHYEQLRVTSCEIAWRATDPDRPPATDRQVCITIAYRQPGHTCEKSKKYETNHKQ